jgi:hypothetical protein
VPDIGVIEGELVRLLGDGVGDFGAAVTDVDAVKTGERIQALLAGAVGNVDPLAGFDDAHRRLAGGVPPHIR